jgi:peptidoglycan/xylan/chitin deacetylase (PgdA/CDA1 family)
MSAEERRRMLEQLPLDADAGRYDADQMMTWEQVVEMSRNGVEFGGHTMTHPLLVYETDEAVEREVRECKQTVEEKLGRKVRGFAYPNGDWNDRVRRKVADAGYACAFTTERGWHRPGQDRFTIRRLLVHEGNVTGFTGKFSPAVFNLTLTGWR